MLDQLLKNLKDYTKCNDDLAIKIRKNILEPFQLDLSQPESTRKPPPTPTDFKKMAIRLAPYAMSIINGNLKTLPGIKRSKLSSNLYRAALNCLIDTSLYALAALRHMSAYATLEPIEIEKSTSNLICKMVELEEYDRALDEMKKMRSKLATHAKVQLKPASARTALQEVIKRDTEPASTLLKTQWEDDMINKYQDLFQFPLNTDVTNQDIMLLVLSYQMNTIRCWCALKNGALAKLLPSLIRKPGNFFDWCLHLYKFDKATARLQLVTLQRTLYLVANKIPLTEDSAIHSYDLQVIALKALKLAEGSDMQLILDRMVRIGVTYEKATKQTLYKHLQETCHNFLEDLQPNVNNLSEMNAYFMLCDYYAYTSKKANIYKGAFYAYKFLIRSLRDVLEDPRKHTYFFTAFAAKAKLSLGSVQMDKMVMNDTFADISTTLTESISLLKFVTSSIDKNSPPNEHTTRALYSLYQAIESFKISSNRLFEHIVKKAKQELSEGQDDSFKTPPRPGEFITPSNYGQWNSVVTYLSSVLEQCSEALLANFCLLKSQAASCKNITQPTSVMKTYVDIMTILAKMEFNINDEDTYQPAYEFLLTAEQVCMEKKYTSGYRWLASTYYTFSTNLVQMESFGNAKYPTRKACTLLEKDPERANSEEGRIQLCKRYEILGLCGQKSQDYEDAITSFRLALKRIPASLVEKFVRRAESTAVSTIMEQETLIPKLIQRFLVASIYDPDKHDIQFASEHINVSTITPIQQCIVYECELKVWQILSLKYTVSRFQNAIINKLLQTYDAEKFPIRRARVILNRLLVERTSNKKSRTDGLRAAIASAKQVLELLNVENYQEDINLLNYRVHYIASANSWIAICGRELRLEVPNTFTTTLQQWGALLKKITPIYNSGGSSKQDIEQVYNSIDDVDQFYGHVRMLADLFAISGEYVYQICALRILLKLNNGLRKADEDHVSDSIILSSTIGRIYCDLGYTGKASLEFNQALNAVTHRSCSHLAEVVYRINYTYYLTCISDYETSQEAFKIAKMVWQHAPEEDAKDSYTTVKTYTKRCTLLADAYFTLAKIQANTETLDLAIESVTCSLQLLNKCIKVLQTAHQEKQGEISNPFMPSPPPEPTKVVFRESQWEFAHKLSATLQYAAYLCIQKGSWNEAAYFVKQGPSLAEKVNSSFMHFNSALCAADFYLRCGDISKAQDHFETATKRQLKGSYHLFDEAKLKSTMGDMAFANQYYDMALETYEEANELLENICAPEYMAELEALIHGENTSDTKVKFQDEQHEPSECVPLRRLQSLNILQKSKSMAQKEDIDNALATLEQLEESDNAIDHIIELNSLISQWRLQSIEKQLEKEGQITILPSMKRKATPARGSMSKRNSTPAVKEDLSNIVESMMEAYQIGVNRERVSIIHNLCSRLGSSMLFKEMIASLQSRTLVNNHALLSAFYMTMANGVNMRREMQNCLKIKMNKRIPNCQPSDSAWPPTDEEQIQERYSRFARVAQNPRWLQAHLQTLSDLYSNEHEFDDKQFQDKFVDILPEHWTVCSISIDPVNQDIYAAQLRANETPFVVKLPMNRAQRRSQENPAAISFEEAQAELKDIIEKSDETIHGVKGTADTMQVKAWWDKRIALDNRLKTLLENMENQWFSGFKGLMCGRYQEYKEEVVKFQKGLIDVAYKHVNALATVKKVEFSLEFCRLALKLGRYPVVRDLEDLAYYMFNCYETQGVQITYSKVEIKKLTDELRVLLNRYYDKCSMVGVPSNKSIPNDHVILILDKHVQAFPVESMPLLRGQSVSRLPSLSLLRDRILYAQSYNTRAAFDDFGVVSTNGWEELKVSRKSAYYVVNPSGDLKDTQKEFQDIFKSVPEWDGIMGTAPPEFQCKNALQSKDIYMYFGHSAGQTFMRGTTVRQLPTCAVSLLMGCSSGALETSGEFDPYGYVLNFLLGGSPAVVANLWDVTDKSIDRLTKSMLSSWGLLRNNSKSKSLVQAVNESRNACKLTYLIGAAPVVYGIPVYIKEEN